MDAGKLQQAIELYDRFTHEGMDRRDFFARMTLIAGGAAAATSLIASIAASPAAAAIVRPDDKRLTTRDMTFDHPAGYKAYVAEQRTRFT
jgi:carboxymethylenebutenolidase